MTTSNKRTTINKRKLCLAPKIYEKTLAKLPSHSCPPGKPRRALEHSSAFRLRNIHRRDRHCTKVLNAWSDARAAGCILRGCLQKQGMRKPGGTSLGSLLIPGWLPGEAREGAGAPQVRTSWCPGR